MLFLESGFCLKASICNAVGSSGSIEKALTFANSFRISGTLACAGVDVDKVQHRFCLCNAQSLDRHRNLVDRLEGLTSNIHLVRLQGIRMENDSAVGHVVATNGGKRVIWDCMERYEIRLSPGKLRYQVGDAAVLIGVKELKKWVVHPAQTSKKRRKPHKMNAKKV